jgi:hypothetical protein
VFDVPLDESIVIETGAAARDLEPCADRQLALWSDLKAVTGQPVSLDEEKLVVAMTDGRQFDVELERIQAIAVAEVAGLADDPVVVIDLALDWRTGASDAGDALRSVLGTLMERTSAIPLPDPDAALGLMIPAYASVLDYEREVLQIAR